MACTIKLRYCKHVSNYIDRYIYIYIQCCAHTKYGTYIFSKVIIRIASRKGDWFVKYINILTLQIIIVRINLLNFNFIYS